MKKLTLVTKNYGTLQVPKECPNTPEEALAYIDKNDLWGQVSWESGEYLPDKVELVFIDDENGEPLFER